MILSSEQNSQNFEDDYTLRPRQYGHHFAGDIFRWIFLNEKFFILIKISSNIVSKGPIDKTMHWFRIMAWCRIGGKLLSIPMLTRFTDAYMRHYGEMS